MIPRIDPVPAGAARPLWSVMIPIYNGAHFLTRSLTSILEQDPGAMEMQIEVVDNCSEDDPEAVVRQIGGGRVLFHRNDRNLGMFGNFNACITRSRGCLVHLLNCDDYVGPAFYRKISDAFAESTECSAIFCRSFVVDNGGATLGSSDFCASLATIGHDPREFLMSNPVRTPGVVVRRSLYERQGGFDTSLTHTSDWEMWVRAIVQGGARMLDEPLAYYRVHDQSASNRVNRLAAGLADQLRLSAKWQAAMLPGFDHRAFERQTVRAALVRSLQFAVGGDREAAAANWRLWRRHAVPAQMPLIALELIQALMRRIVDGNRLP